MKIPSRSTVALIVTSIVSLVLLGILLCTNQSNLDWLPQAVVSLAGLVGASWFVGYRLDLMDKDISQRHDVADAQLNATEHANFNDAIKEAVEMMSSDATSSVLAGQRWLHAIADVGPTEANLVQTLLCSYLSDVLAAGPAVSPTDLPAKSCQSALNLLFRSPGSARFNRCDAIPELNSTQWRALDFTDLNLRSANFAGSDFTDAVVVGSRFDTCDLRETKWSGVGGDSRTFMREAKLCGVTASSVTFTNVDFTGANLSNNGRRTLFQACTFLECNFERSDWTGATFVNCKFIQCDFKDAIWDGAILKITHFDQCPTVTLDLCSKAKMQQPAGLPNDVVEGLRKMGLSEDR